MEEVSMEAPLSPIPCRLTSPAVSRFKEKFHLDAQTYQDPTIQVSITEKDITITSGLQRQRRPGLDQVDIKIGDASQLRTAAVESFETTNHPAR